MIHTVPLSASLLPAGQLIAQAQKSTLIALPHEVEKAGGALERIAGELYVPRFATDRGVDDFETPRLAALVCNKGVVGTGLARMVVMPRRCEDGLICWLNSSAG